ncbi:hypothetical protein [Microbacterium sp. SS28]|uniref:hypothetical protein n=1 Tax=Microbacterium sp. SS28 TaxID=2919948 RepID=UPI001FAB3283|nr:hypothetical protein [Microbacterium sp. SS28]
MSSPGPLSGETTSEPPADFGRHNMFVFGRGTVFLSHLPMFMAPHDAQLLLEVAVEKDGSELGDAWSAERAEHPDERLYTVMPEKFALSSLYATDPPERESFRATFFRGHLERGGEPIPDFSDVEVRISDIVYARRFDRQVPLDELTYRLVGRGDELFLAHVITEPPDFDQILSVALTGERPDDDDLRAGIEVVFEGRANTAEARVRSAEKVTGRGHVTGAHRFMTLEFDQVSELYFEEGELSTSRGAFEPTPLETESGFGD